MIYLEIINCPNYEFEGIWRFQKNMVYIGHPEGDIKPVIEELLPNTMLIEVVPDLILAHPHKDLPFFLHNGKRTTAVKRLKIGDTINFCGIELKILEAKYTEYPTKKEVLDTKLQEVMEQDGPLAQLISDIGSVMRELP